MSESILIADDHSIVRIGLSITIKKLRPQATIEEADDFRNVLELIKNVKFDLVILDVNMPNGNFQQTLDLIKLKQPETKVLVFSSQDEHIYAIRYLKLGADGFLHKLADEDKIRKALERMFSRGSYLSDEVQEALVYQSLNKKQAAQNPLTTLSSRELDIANMLIAGSALKEISNELNLHVSTVSTYKSRIFKKLDVQSIPELIAIFHFYADLIK